jgi:hypothetical protein
LSDVALKWLPKINVSARKEIYDSFFVKGLPTNLEGNPSNCNSFSVLPVEEIAHVTSCMGIIVEDDNFATFNLM